MAKDFYSLKEPEREHVVRRLMEAGGSNHTVAKKLGTKPNTIASYRNRKKIPSTNKAPSMGKPTEEPEPQAPSPPLPAPAPAPQEPPRRHKMSATEATQCLAQDEDGRRCGYERLPGSGYCGLPQHQALHNKEPARRS